MTALAPTLAGARLLHTMLRVRDLDASLAFYCGLLGMRLLRREEFREGEFTLAFVGYESEEEGTVLELTWNWNSEVYKLGTAYGHIALGVADISAAVAALEERGVRVVRAPGPLKGKASEIIAFIVDPDDYRIELIERKPQA
jgi:lactoylglutathione lyase